jgi:hypothetical protein
LGGDRYDSRICDGLCSEVSEGVWEEGFLRYEIRNTKYEGMSSVEIILQPHHLLNLTYSNPNIQINLFCTSTISR